MKKLIIVAAIAIAAGSAQAGYLWWTVNSTMNGNMADVVSYVDGGATWDTANIYYYNDTTAKTLLDTTEKMPTAAGLVATYDSQTTTDLSTLKDGAASYSYYVELVNSKASGQVVAYTSAPIAYSDISGSITTTLEDIPSVTPWHGGTYKAAPEPTSAMLMLLGVAGLALRRKQRKIA